MKIIKMLMLLQSWSVSLWSLTMRQSDLFQDMDACQNKVKSRRNPIVKGGNLFFCLEKSIMRFRAACLSNI